MFSPVIILYMILHIVYEIAYDIIFTTLYTISEYNVVENFLPYFQYQLQIQEGNIYNQRCIHSVKDCTTQHGPSYYDILQRFSIQILLCNIVYVVRFVILYCNSVSHYDVVQRHCWITSCLQRYSTTTQHSTTILHDNITCGHRNAISCARSWATLEKNVTATTQMIQQYNNICSKYDVGLYHDIFTQIS